MSNQVTGSNQATGSHQEHHRQHRVGWLRAGAISMATTALVGIAFDVAV